MIPLGDDTVRLGYTIGCSIVASFWWFKVPIRTHAVGNLFAVALHLTSMVFVDTESP